MKGKQDGSHRKSLQVAYVYRAGDGNKSKDDALTVADARHREGVRDEGVDQPRGRRPGAVIASVCLLLLVGLICVWGVILSSLGDQRHLPSTPEEWGQTVCGMLLEVGLPDLQTPLWQKLGFDGGEETPEDTTVQETETDGKDIQSVQIQIRETDLSFSHLGMGYWEGDAGCIPPAYADVQGLFSPQRRRVLVVCSRPYAVYADGEGQSLTVSQGDSFAVCMPEDGGLPEGGAVDLAKTLTEELNARGVDAVMLPCVEGASYTDTYEATCAAVEVYLALHPEVGLVLDIGRSAELLPDGDMPRSLTAYDGTPVAQLRMTVDVGRGSGASLDYTLATALRKELFALSPTISRPVYLRRGSGLGADGDVAFLTLSLGTAGNTYGEARPLLTPLSDALARLLS